MADEFVGYAASFVPAGYSAAQVRESVAAWYGTFPSQGRIALVDNSLLARVQALLQPSAGDPSRCTAEGLVALNAWLNAVVLYDRVIHLANDDVPDDAWTKGTALDGAVSAIDCDLGSAVPRFPGLHQYLEHLVKARGPSLRGMLDEEAARKCVWDSWSAAFGSHIGTNGDRHLGWPNGPRFADIDFDSDWASRTWSSEATEVTRVLTSDALYLSPENLLDEDASNRLTSEELKTILTDGCMRAQANMLLATNSGTTYVPSPIRLPIVAWLKADEEGRWWELETRFLESVQNRASKSPDVHDLLDARTVRLPPLLATALTLCDRQHASRLVDVAGELREMATKLRGLLEVAERKPEAAAKEYRQAWNEAEAALADLDKTLGSKVAKAGASVGGALVLGQAGDLIGQTLGTGAEVLGTLVAAAERALNTGATGHAKTAAEQAIARFRNRPGVFIAHLVDSTRRAALHGAEALVQSLWGIDGRRAKAIVARANAFSLAFRNTATPRSVARAT